VTLEPCPHVVLTLNVLLRARGSLLLAEMPLLDEPAALTAGMASDDSRLIALAGRPE
jgi:hypothetical protein